MKTRVALVATWIAYAAITAYVAWHHEPWRDEADVWLQARDRSLVEMFRLMAYSGTPGLWHLLIFPFAKLGAPYETQQVLHWLVALASAHLLLRAPLPLAVRLLLLFGDLFAFEYVVVVRTYALTVLGLLTAAALYPVRARRPWLFGVVVALTANTNVFGMFAAGAFTALLVVDVALARRRGALERSALGAPLVAIAGCALAVLQVLPPADGQFAHFVENYEPQHVGNGLRAVLFPLGSQDQRLAGAIVVVVAAVARLWRSPRAIVWLVLCYAQLAYLWTFKYGGQLRHQGFLVVFLVVALWIGATEVPASPSARARLARAGFALLLCVPLAISCRDAFHRWRQEIAEPFSNAKLVAHYLRDQKLTARPIVSHLAPIGEAVLPYLDGVRLYYAAHDEFGTHMWWDARQIEGKKIPHEEIVARVKSKFPDWQDRERGPLLLFDRPLNNATALGYRLRYRPPQRPFAIKDEWYWLYEPV